MSDYAALQASADLEQFEHFGELVTLTHALGNIELTAIVDRQANAPKPDNVEVARQVGLRAFFWFLAEELPADLVGSSVALASGKVYPVITWLPAYGIQALVAFDAGPNGVAADIDGEPVSGCLLSDFYQGLGMDSQMTLFVAPAAALAAVEHGQSLDINGSFYRVQVLQPHTPEEGLTTLQLAAL